MIRIFKVAVFACICIAINIGCDVLSTTPIGKIIENPREYSDRTLTISGEVAEAHGFLVMKYFVLRDETGEIPVVTNKTLPKKGTKLKIKGIIKEAFAIGDRQLLVFIESNEGKQ
jgi:hypothetical protein